MVVIAWESVVSKSNIETIITKSNTILVVCLNFIRISISVSPDINYNYSQFPILFYILNQVANDREHSQPDQFVLQ